jgi:hypothetical protein
MQKKAEKISAIILGGLLVFFLGCVQHSMTSKNEPHHSYLASSGQSIKIDEQYSFTYSFDSKPKLGTSILKVEILDSTQKKVTPFDIYTESDMPEMKGMHGSGLKKLLLNQKGSYLIPLDFVMPGVWEIKITMKKDEQEVFSGVVKIEI